MRAPSRCTLSAGISRRRRSRPTSRVVSQSVQQRCAYVTRPSFLRSDRGPGRPWVLGRRTTSWPSWPRTRRTAGGESKTTFSARAGVMTSLPLDPLEAHHPSLYAESASHDDRGEWRKPPSHAILGRRTARARVRGPRRSIECSSLSLILDRWPSSARRARRATTLTLAWRPATTFSSRATRSPCVRRLYESRPSVVDRRRHLQPSPTFRGHFGRGPTRSLRRRSPRSSGSDRCG